MQITQANCADHLALAPPKFAETLIITSDNEPWESTHELEGSLAPVTPAPKPIAKRLNPIKLKQIEDRVAAIEDELSNLDARIAQAEQQQAVFTTAGVRTRHRVRARSPPSRATRHYPHRRVGRARLATRRTNHRLTLLLFFLSSPKGICFSPSATISHAHTHRFGFGATGGFYGGRLGTDRPRRVTFLFVRHARAEKLRCNGLEIVSPLGNATIQPQLIAADELRANAQVFDLILLATKSYSLEAAIEDFAPAVGPRTTILPILNGMRQLDLLDARFGAERVIGGTCRINSDVDPDGRILQLSTLGDLTFGERDREHTPRIQRISDELAGALFKAILSPDVLAAMWHKWYVLAALNILCVLPQGTVGEVVAVPQGLAFANDSIDECIAIATANGYPPPAALIASDRKRLTEPGSDLTSSMYRDMLKLAAVEADHVIGDLIARGESHNVLTPLLRATYVRLKVYSSKRQR